MNDKDLLVRVEKLRKEKVEKEEEHTQEIEDVIAELKSSTAVFERHISRW